MYSPSILPENLSLLPHQTARDKVVSTCQLPAATVILSVRSLTTTLLPNEKGHRCDFCLSLASQNNGRLQRCSGCASYWYCDSKCQVSHWRTHKKYCKNINAFLASSKFSQLEQHEKADALLLTHLLAEYSTRSTEGEKSDLSVFLSLLPSPDTTKRAPPTCPLSAPKLSIPTVGELFSRCGNNNFSVHSHLTTIAHGVFPLASRSFNHSCLPNAVSKYKIAQSQEVVMQIVTLRDIAQNEEICIPYVDPALVETRQQMFNFTYGFRCTCPSCAALERLDPSWPVPDGEELDSLATSLREFVFPDPSPDALALPSSPVNLATMPVEILHIFREACLAKLCESFSTFSHDGPFESALDVGLKILSFYVVVYPPNYPQIGMHVLEMAKTAWNVFVTMADANLVSQSALVAQTRAYLRLSTQILEVVGSEGDEGGPLAEIQVLECLLSE